MSYNIYEELINPESKIAHYFANAEVIWKNIHSNQDNLDTVVRAEQLEFEHDCGDRGLGAEIMVWSGIMREMHQTPPNIESAKKVYDALAKHNCSIEVKVCAKDVAKVYGLDK